MKQTPKVGDPRDVAEATRSSRPLWVLVSGLCGVVLYFAHAAFIPIALALLFALVLSSPVEALHRQGLPRSVSAILILMIFLGLTGGAVNLLWEPAQQWLAGAPRIVKILEQKIGPAARVMHRIDAVTDRAGHLTEAGGSTITAATSATRAPSASRGLLLETRTALVAMVTVVILTLFLLAGGPPMLAKMTASPASELHSTHVLHMIEAVRREVAPVIGLILSACAGNALSELAPGAHSCRHRPGWRRLVKRQRPNPGSGRQGRVHRA